ncbi:hypothetical protein NE237_019108 [Protea cynaroides]|uniref:Uncharacterized protein n=1 Tax=Protea cynaroides TaxID=273540 RepID=A0A9Q0QPS7_9MAGN|nr:hypothetical protein NE237_019108 [Protea cynaroides]
MVWLIIFICLDYVVYTLKLLSTSCPCREDSLVPMHLLSTSSGVSNVIVFAAEVDQNETVLNVGRLQHIVFGIAVLARLWEPKEMRGIVWSDKSVKTHSNKGFQPVKISCDTSQFDYKNKQGHQLAIRILRIGIVSESMRLGMEGVR